MKILLKIEKVLVLLLILMGTTYLAERWLSFLPSSLPFAGSIVILLVSLAVLAFFWKRWAHSKIVIVVGLFVVLIELMPVFLVSSTLLSPGNIGGGFREGALMTFTFASIYLIAPFLLLFPILTPLAIAYAYFRGLLRDQSIIQQEELTAAKTKESKTRNTFAIVIAAVVIIGVSSPAYYILHTGTKDIAVPDDPLVGKKIVFGNPMVYTQDCTLCGGSPKELQIGRNLECMPDLENMGSYFFKDKFKNVTYVPSTMEFSVQEVFKPHTYGIESIDSGPGDYRVAVLKDSNGVLSAKLVDYLDSEKYSCSPEAYINKLFRYIETAGRARIELILYSYDFDNHRVRPSEEVQQKLISSLPKKYNFSNLTKVPATSIPGLAGVQMDIDADALAFLVSSASDLDIWRISGLDTAYRSTLNEADVVEMNKIPGSLE